MYVYIYIYNSLIGKPNEKINCLTTGNIPQFFHLISYLLKHFSLIGVSNGEDCLTTVNPATYLSSFI